MRQIFTEGWQIARHVGKILADQFIAMNQDVHDAEANDPIIAQGMTLLANAAAAHGVDVSGIVKTDGDLLNLAQNASIQLADPIASVAGASSIAGATTVTSAETITGSDTVTGSETVTGAEVDTNEGSVDGAATESVAGASTSGA